MTVAEYDLSRKLFFVIGSWKYPASKEEFVSVTLQLPTGIGEQTDDFQICAENVILLPAEISSPEAISDGKVLHRKWIQGHAIKKSRAILAFWR